VYSFSDPLLVHFVAFSVDYFGMMSQSITWLKEMVWSVTADLFCSVAEDLLVLCVEALTSGGVGNFLLVT